MTLKEEIHSWVEELPEDSPALLSIHESLRIDLAIAEALEDEREGRVYEADEFLAMVKQRWPNGASS